MRLKTFEEIYEDFLIAKAGDAIELASPKTLTAIVEKFNGLTNFKVDEVVREFDSFAHFHDPIFARLCAEWGECTDARKRVIKELLNFIAGTGEKPHRRYMQL